MSESNISFFLAVTHISIFLFKIKVIIENELGIHRMFTYTSL